MWTSPSKDNKFINDLRQFNFFCVFCFLKFILSSTPDNRKVFRFRGRRGKFAELNIAGSFFGYIILGRNID